METGYRNLAQYYSLLFPLNDRQRGFFAQLLEEAPADSVLDAGCGTGEHLSWFTGRGLRAYGLEPDAEMFRELERRRWPGRAPTLVRAGLDALPGAIDGTVDLALCLGNTLPHLPDPAAVLSALRGMAGSLSPRGRVALQTVNFDRVLDGGAGAFPVIERTLPDGGRVAFSREYDHEAVPGRLLFRTRLVTPDGERRTAWPLLPLRREELAGCAADAGLRAIRVFGDYDRSPWTATAPALILTGER